MSYHPPPEPDSWRDVAWAAASYTGIIALGALVLLVLRACWRLLL